MSQEPKKKEQEKKVQQSEQEPQETTVKIKSAKGWPGLIQNQETKKVYFKVKTPNIQKIEKKIGT